MSYSFSCYGHQNITSRHKNSLEFTKDSDVTLKGDCVIGVNVDFDLKVLKEFIKKNKDKKVRMKITANSISDEVLFDLNPEFDDEREIVIRKSSFLSLRTLGINSDKGADDLEKNLKKALSQNQKVYVTIDKTQQDLKRL